MDLLMYDPVTDTPSRTRSSNLCQQLGQVEYIFSDKTGTLTQNVMKLKLCHIDGTCYGDKNSVDFDPKEMLQDLALQDERAAIIHSFLRLLAVSHTVVPEHDGDTLDYQAESPDEAAMVLGAARVGYTFVAREGNIVTVDLQGKNLEKFEILVVNVFNSTRKRMSVVCRTPEGKLVLLCKGADNVMLQRCEGGGNDPRYKSLTEDLDSFAGLGLRTLVMAMRELDEGEFVEWKKGFDAAAASLSDRNQRMAACAEEIEVGMTVLGATGVEDKLQDSVADTIFDLARAGIKLWVLTGERNELSHYPPRLQLHPPLCSSLCFPLLLPFALHCRHIYTPQTHALPFRGQEGDGH